MSNQLLHVTFVCTGNICRSPMAEKVFAHQIAERGLDTHVQVSSAGTGAWHVGCEVDERADHVLRSHGYPTEHCAAQVDDYHLTADLVVALARNHARILAHAGVPTGRLRLLRSFDPRASTHTPDVDDPYYGAHTEFEQTLATIEAALPGLHDWVDEQLTQRGINT